MPDIPTESYRVFINLDSKAGKVNINTRILGFKRAGENWYMKLTNDLFHAYFTKQIDINDFIKNLGIYEEDFLEHLLHQIKEVFIVQDAERVEYLIYALWFWYNQIGRENVQELESFVDQLNELLVSDWHYKHEDIVLLLEEISSDKSIEYLYDAIELHPQYLSWDENYAFEVKCVRVIYYIGKDKAFPYLEKLCKHSNEVIREMAQRQISKLM